MVAWGKRSFGIGSALAAALLVVAALIAAAGAQARVGALDPSFGDAGIVGPELREAGGASGMDMGPDGTVVVADGRTLVRLLPDGAVDSGFGDGGRVQLPDELDGLEFAVSDVAVDGERRVLVSGTIRDPTQVGGSSNVLISFTASWAIVLRLKADGELDLSFGEGKGYVRGDYGMHPINDTSPENGDISSAGALRVAVDSLDRPLLLVTTAGAFSPCWGHSGADQYPRAVVRLTATGTVDSTFGDGDGIAPLDQLAPSPETFFALDSADQPVVGGGVGTACPHQGILFRLAADGSRLAGFGSDGARTYPRRYLTVLAPSGAMLLRGIVRQAVLKVGSDGEPDRSFGEEGEVNLGPLADHRSVQPVAVDAQGRTLLAGTLVLPKPPEHRFHKPLRHRRTRRAFLQVGRLLPNGEVDRGFGRRGWIVTPIGPHYRLYLGEAILDAQGRLVVLGQVSTTRRGSGFVLARYLLNG